LSQDTKDSGRGRMGIEFGLESRTQIMGMIYKRKGQERIGKERKVGGRTLNRQREEYNGVSWGLGFRESFWSLRAQPASPVTYDCWMKCDFN